MQVSTHYYVLSLSRHRNALYEAFRDQLIEVQNMGFPVWPSTRIDGAQSSIEHDERVLELMGMVDQNFGNYDRQEPLGMVVTGESDLQFAFLSVTAHQDIIIGHANGDYSRSEPRDLGRITWTIVKDAMSGVVQKALRDLEALADGVMVASGLDVVARRADAGESGTLLVEEDYHVKGSLVVRGESLNIIRSVDVREAMDDVVDVVIDRILNSGGTVVFLPGGSLPHHDRIVLLSHEVANVP